MKCCDHRIPKDIKGTYEKSKCKICYMLYVKL